LEACPQLDVLIRPGHLNCAPLRYVPQFNHAADDFTAAGALRRLRRLDWWHLDPAHQTGGINSLEHVISCAPDIEYLTIGGLVSTCALSPRRWELPKLETLRLSRLNERLLWSIQRWSLPSLKNIVVEMTPNERTLAVSVWPAFGATLASVEFGADLSFLVTDQIAPALQGCPNLEELAYHINFSHPPPTETTHASLARVRLHAHPNQLVSQDVSEYWRHLQGHFAFLASSSLPALREIVLHGDWANIIHHTHFNTAMSTLCAKQRNVVFFDGTAL
jgi:hypothetical protein